MAWRPSDYVIKGTLKEVGNRVKGEIEFAGIKRPVKFNLRGHFAGKLDGKKISFKGEGKYAEKEDAAEYMKQFANPQMGYLPSPVEMDGDYLYISFDSDVNGTVTIEIPKGDVTVS